MNRDDVIRMAREAFIKRGFWPNEVMWECWKDAWIQGAAAERAEVERLKLLCEEMLRELYVYRASEYLKDVTAAIRARGNT